MSSFDNFAAWVPIGDASMFASQSLQISHQAAEREDSTGTFWSPVTCYKGDYLLIPPAGAEGRGFRMIAKSSRNNPDTSIDPSIDDTSLRLFATPRYLTFPD